MLSRARLDGKPSDRIVAAYLHWGIFELPGLNLDDIPIPVREFPADGLPGKEEVREMVEESAAALDRLASGSNATRIGSIRKEMDAFGADPREYSKYLGEPSLTESGCGTHFYIIPGRPDHQRRH